MEKIEVKKIFMGIKEALLFSFSTSSSSATIPVTLDCVKKTLKLKII